MGEALKGALKNVGTFLCVVFGNARKSQFMDLPQSRLRCLKRTDIYGLNVGLYCPPKLVFQEEGTGLGLRIGKNIEVGDYKVDAGVGVVYKMPCKLVVSADKDFNNNHKLEVFSGQGIEGEEFFDSLVSRVIYSGIMTNDKYVFRVSFDSEEQCYDVSDNKKVKDKDNLCLEFGKNLCSYGGEKLRLNLLARFLFKRCSIGGRANFCSYGDYVDDFDFFEDGPNRYGAGACIGITAKNPWPKLLIDNIALDIYRDRFADGGKSSPGIDASTGAKLSFDFQSNCTLGSYIKKVSLITSMDNACSGRYGYSVDLMG